MTANPSFEKFLRALQKRHGALNDTLNVIHSRYALLDDEGFQETRSLLIGRIEDVRELLNQDDFPVWLDQLENWASRAYSEQTDQTRRGLLDQFINLRSAVLNFRWENEISDKAGILNIKALIRDVEAKNRIPELFKEATDLVAQVARHEQIDSRLVQESLEGVLQTLIAARTQSFTGRKIASKGLAIFLKNFADQSLEDIPGVGTAWKALKKTARELDGAFEVAEQEIEAETSKAAIENAAVEKLKLTHHEVKKIEHKPNTEAASNV